MTITLTLLPHPSLNAMDTWALFRVLFWRGSWGDLASETVVDIRSCANRNCTNFLVLFYPKIKEVVSTNEIPFIISLNRFRFRHPKIVYQVMNLRDRSTLIRWENSVKKVVSSNYFDTCLDQREAFRNLFYILKPGGEAALIFNIQSGYYDWFLELVSHPKWKKYHDSARVFIPDSHYNNYRAEYYEQLFLETGFTVLYIQDDPMIYVYSSEKNCKEGALNSSMFSIPQILLEEFTEDSFQIFLKHNGGRDPLGSPCLRYRSIIVLLKKPLQNDG